jgi:hypothetical protein
MLLLSGSRAALDEGEGTRNGDHQGGAGVDLIRYQETVDAWTPRE